MQYDDWNNWDFFGFCCIRTRHVRFMNANPHFNVGNYISLNKSQVITKQFIESKVLTKFLKYVRTNTADLNFLFVFCTTLLFSTCQKAAIVFFTEYKISLIHSTARWRRPCIANPERRMKVSTHVSFVNSHVGQCLVVGSRNSSER